MGSSAARAARGRWLLVGLLLVLAAGFAVRLWYLARGLEAGRFFDERFSFQNVLPLLEHGSLKPLNGYYPLLSYLPQALLLWLAELLYRLTGLDWLEVRQGAHFTPSAYLLSRLVQALWGVGAIWLTFLAGRRLFSDSVGLVAATAVAFSPGLVHASGVFKPEASTVLAVLLTFTWSLAAAQRPTAGRYALAGGGVALAMSTKLTGGLAALPLVFVSLLRCRREPRRLALLALAGGVAAALFLLLNPYWPLYLEYLDTLTNQYRHWAATREVSRGQLPALLGQLLAQSLGWVGLGAAVGGAAALLVSLARRRLDSGVAAGVAMLLFFPPAWTAAYAIKTAYFKSNNFLPVVPLVALVAAWGLVEAGRLLAPRLSPAGGRPLLVAMGVAAVVALFVPRGVVAVHRLITPSGEDVALRHVDRRLRGHPGCQIVYERGAGRWPPWERAGRPKSCVTRPVDRLDEVDLAELRLTDGVVFPQRRLLGNTAKLYLDLVAASDERQTAVFMRRGLQTRGPGSVAALFPWAAREPGRELALRPRPHGPFRLEADLPAAVAAGEVVSYTLWLPASALSESLPVPRLKTDGRIVDLLWVRRDGDGAHYASPRLVTRQRAPRVRLNRRQAAPPDGEIRLALWRWRR